MGTERLFRDAEKRRNPIPLPWIRVPRNKDALEQIVEVLDMIPDSEHFEAKKFWKSVRAHVAYLIEKPWNGK